MADRVETAAVLGAGVMGAGIAAHLAGAGIRVHLLDIVPPKLEGAEKDDPEARNRFATESIKKALKAKPAAFYDKDAARLISCGNLDDHLDRLKECDLIIEAIIENIDIKKQLFAKVAKVVKKKAILASNTSGLSIDEMTADLPADLQKRFLVLHFFNPVRYMKLLEIIPGTKTDPKIVERCTAFGEYLGKGVVFGKDTPNFIANRIGMYGLMKVIKTMEEDGFTIEEIDAICGQPMGRPRSAAFKTGDMVGIDTFVHVAQNCYDNLTDDEARDIFTMPDWIMKLVEEGNLGRKSGGGFYKKEGKALMVLDYKTGKYREKEKVRFDSIGATKGVDDPAKRVKKMVNGEDKAAAFAWKVMAHTLCYAARRLGEISDDIVNIDNAMRWGFNWDLGPFQTWDAIGVPQSVERMKKDGIEVPQNILNMLESGRTKFYDGKLSEQTYCDLLNKTSKPMVKDPKHIRLAEVRENKKNIVKKTLGATLLDIGDGALCLEVHTKMNTIDDDVVKMLKEGVKQAEKKFEALVIANDGEHFGAGANLMMVLMAAKMKQFQQIEPVVKDLQDALQGVRYANVPVVAAPFQYTFGGCAEIAMAADACQAHAETYIGLVEVGAGLIPAGCGCLRMVERWGCPVQNVEGVDLLPHIGTAAINIAMAKVATGAEEGRRLRYLLPTDGISLSRDRLLYEAKQRALGMARAGYRPPRPRVIKAAGIDAAKTINVKVWSMVEGNWATEHDAVVAKKLIHVICGGDVLAGTELTEQDYLDLEREAFLSLCGEEKSQARMESLLQTGKPLRN